MIGGPFLVAIVPGVLVLLITWWFRKLNFSLFVRIVPSILTVIAAIILFYIGFVNIRGFEGAAYGILAFSLIGFAIVSFVIANKKPSVDG
ncbi:YesK family protein [Halobacillus ihumii]|uniref:YesK family protein n=1 Tax=Halobacillus ihumii TaxID=2686092 RepID=UPI0013D1FB9E|nr:YesK family protein [Halobacillus ihumii]